MLSLGGLNGEFGALSRPPPVVLDSHDYRAALPPPSSRFVLVSAPIGAGIAVPAPGDRRADFYHWAGRLAQALVELRGRFEGDLDQFLICLVLALAELRRRQRPEADAAHGLNILSIADITAIPRESVRRKLGVLERRGLAMRGRDGLYSLGDDAAGLDLVRQGLESLA